MNEDTDTRTLEAQRRERRFALFGTMAILAGLALIATVMWFAVPTPPRDDFGPVSDFPPAEEPYEVHANNHIYFVVNFDGDLFVLEAVSPSADSTCRVLWVDSFSQFIEPCHGSKFTRTGEWIWGPAPRGMDRFGYTVEDGMLIVNRWQRIEGDPHS
jgi:nitrite reductase/ring-hydroxylating ferredoxin subunit